MSNQIYHVSITYDFVMEAATPEAARKRADYHMKEEVSVPPSKVEALVITRLEDLPPNCDADSLVYGPDSQQRVRHFLDIAPPLEGKEWSDIKAKLAEARLPVPDTEEFASFYIRRISRFYDGLEISSGKNGENWTVAIWDEKLKRLSAFATPNHASAKTMELALGKVCVLLIDFERQNGLNRFVP